MIDVLEGRLVLKSLTRDVIECGGVGYEVLVPMTTSSTLPPANTSVRLLTVFHVREDAHVLYGFATELDREMFRTLTGVSGVGPKIALAGLSCLSAQDLAAAIGRRDAAAIKSIPGVGQKLANRIVTELEDYSLKVAGMEGPIATDGSQRAHRSQPLHDAELALIALGHTPAAARRIVTNVARTTPAIRDDIDALIRMAMTQR